MEDYNNKLRDLKKKLAQYFDTNSAARIIAEDAGLDSTNIDFDGSVLETWCSILQEACKHHKINNILDIAKSEYPSAIFINDSNKVCSLGFTVWKNIIIFFISLVMVYLSIILVYRFFTYEHLTSFLHTVETMSVPSTITLFLAFIGVFLTPPDLRTKIQLFTKKILNKSTYSYGVFAFSLISLLVVYKLTYTFTPFKWQEFIDKAFLTGEQSSYMKVNGIIEKLKDIDVYNAQILEEGVAIFSLREEINHEKLELTVDSLRKSIIFLEQEISKNKYIASFQYFALGEGYSISMDIEAYDSSTAKEKALKYYNLFDKNNDGTSTILLTSSSKLNQGNIYWYAGEREKAFSRWNQVPESASKYINLAAAYVMNNQFEKAIQTAQKGMAYVNSKNNSERNNYDALVENTMIAYLGQNNPKQAINYFKSKTSGSLIPGRSLETTYALSLLLSYEKVKFLKIIRESKQITSKDINLLYGLYYLIEKKNDAAINKFKLAINIDEEDTIKNSVLVEDIKSIFHKKGYLKNKQIKMLLKKLSELDEKVI